MKVMMLESDQGAADDAIDELEAAGHEILRCHESGLDAFPCNALLEDGRCPVQSGVDVAVVYRAHPWPRPRPLERGIECALRDHIPVVIAGSAALHPFDGYATAVARETDNLHDVILAAAHGPLTRESHVATTAAHVALKRKELPSEGVSATAKRVNGRLRVEVLGTGELDHAVRSSLAVEVLAALRRINRFVGGVDISVG